MSQIAYFAECSRRCGFRYEGPKPPPDRCTDCDGVMWSTGGMFAPEGSLLRVGEKPSETKIDLEAAARLLRASMVRPEQDPRIRLRVGIGIWLLLGLAIWGLGAWRGWW